MSVISFQGANGAPIAIDPNLIESVRPAPGGVLVRLIDGVSQLVQEPYSRVLELLTA